MSVDLRTPVVFFIFNRPNTTFRVFNAIREAKPKKLLVVADGARFPEESEKCNKAKGILGNVDWNCEVLTEFSEKNLGCKQRISSGLDWVFSEVEEAIILEDDCLPTQSFFFFCQTLLEYYRDNPRVMHISGNNFQFCNNTSNYSYFFTKYGGIWGWATWRRAWKYYDADMNNWVDTKKNKLLNSTYDDWAEKFYWTEIFNQIVKGEPDTWDYQWLYARWCQKELSIAPSLNLVSNIGFNSNATHTTFENHLSNMRTQDIWEINHPPSIIRDYLADSYIFDYCFGGRELRKKGEFYSRVRQMLSSLKKSVKK